MSSGGHRAKRSLGQNFLTDANICRKIVAAANVGSGNLVVEVGPGRGALTEHLMGSGATILAVEKDRELAPKLKARWPQLGIVLGDALEFPWERLPAGTSILGNLPYNVASPLIWEIVSRCATYSSGVVMVQHEVAQRLAAPHGTKTYGALTAWVQNFARVKYLFKVPPTVFVPRPKVDSAVVRLTPLPAEQRPANPAALAALLKQLFSKRRKQLSTILRQSWTNELQEYLDRAGISPASRPEAITPRQLAGLAVCAFSQHVEKQPRV